MKERTLENIYINASSAIVILNKVFI
nr:unnamed protein product [Callosobruchus chinensis]